MPVARAELNVVAGQTSLADIQKFIGDNNGQNKKLFSKDVNGQQVLYLKSSVGFANKFNGVAGQKQDAARAAVRSAIDVSLTSPGLTQNAKAQGQLRALAANIANINDNGFAAGGGNVKGSRVFDLATAVKTITDRLAQLPTAPANGGPSFDMPTVNLTRLGPAFTSGNAMTAAKTALDGLVVSSTPDQMHAVADALGTAIAHAYTATNPSAADRKTFALTTGETLRAELKAQLGNGGNSGVTDKVLARAVGIAASKFGENQADPLSTQTVYKDTTAITLPDLTINNVRYEAKAYIDAGAFANVFQYEEKAPQQGQTPRQLAVKIATGDGADPRTQAQTARTELRDHTAAFGQGSDHVMGDPGAVRMPDGSVALTSEFLPNGTIYNFGKTMQAAVAAPGPDGQMPSGKISAREAKLMALTLTRDLARGLDHLNGTQGLTHYDFKGPNCMISADGRAKIVDLGSVSADANIKVNQQAKVDNPFWKAPERIFAGDALKDLEKVERHVRKNVSEGADRMLEQAFDAIGLDLSDDANQQFAKDIGSNILDASRPNGYLKNGITVDHKVDVWALGITAHELITGHAVESHWTFHSDFENDLKAWKASNLPVIDGGTAVGQRPTNGRMLSTTGDANIDAFLNGILVGDPGNRPDGATIAGHTILQQPGVGSNETRNLITALKSGDAQRIDQARAALTQSLI